MVRIISYSGWIGHNNIGDEALYAANTNLFSDFELVNKEYYDGSDVILYGGGTVIPRPSYPKRHTKRVIAAIGVGVEDPTFRNQRFAPLDLGYHLGRNDLQYLLDNKYVSFGLHQLDQWSDSISIHRKYINEYIFEPLHNFDYLGVRGPKSKKILGRYGIECDVVGDTALVLKPTEYNHGVNDTIAVTLRGPSREIKYTDDTEYLDIIEEFCQYRSERYTFIFMPFSPEDIPLHVELANSIDNAEFRDFCSYIDVQAAVDEIANCDLVIGERLHAGVLGACSYTPFLSLGYQPKNADFAESIGMDEYHVRLDRLTREWLEDRADEAVASNEIRTRLEDEVEDKRTSITAFADEIIEEIGVAGEV